MTQIKLRIFADGFVQAETIGVKGKRCQDYVGLIEELLNAKMIEKEWTEEYYEMDLLQEEHSVTMDQWEKQ